MGARKPAIYPADDGSFALGGALSAQAGADSRMVHSAKYRVGVGQPGSCHRAMLLTGQPTKAWASRRRKRNAESRPS